MASTTASTTTSNTLVSAASSSSSSSSSSLATTHHHQLLKKNFPSISKRLVSTTISSNIPTVIVTKPKVVTTTNTTSPLSNCSISSSSSNTITNGGGAQTTSENDTNISSTSLSTTTLASTSAPEGKSTTIAAAQPLLPGRKTPLKYGRVTITLDNAILPADRVNPTTTPSVIDGLDPQTEYDLRITGCRMMQIAGTLLRLPQTAMATAQVLFHRFFYARSFVRSPMEIAAMACLVLASKVEEAPRRIRDVINVFHNMKQIRNQSEQKPMLLNQQYVELKNLIIKTERHVLKELGFCVHIQHPFKFIVAVTNFLATSASSTATDERNRKRMQLAWNYMNDSFHSNVCCRFPPESIACACIHLSTRLLRIPLPTSPQWYWLFGVDDSTMDEICLSILSLYTRKPAPLDELEERVRVAKQALDEAKLKARKQQALATAAAAAAAASSTTNNDGGGINSSSSFDPSTLLDSRTNSPIIRSSNVSGTTSETKNLEILSVMNRIKQMQDAKNKTNQSLLPSTSSLSTNVGNTSGRVVTSKNTTANTTPATPVITPAGTPPGSGGEGIKLEKSPHTLITSKRSRSRSRIRGDDYEGRSNISSSGDDEMDYNQRRRRKDRKYDDDVDDYDRRHRQLDSLTPPSRNDNDYEYRRSRQRDYHYHRRNGHSDDYDDDVDDDRGGSRRYTRTSPRSKLSSAVSVVSSTSRRSPSPMDTSDDHRYRKSYAGDDRYVDSSSSSYDRYRSQQPQQRTSVHDRLHYRDSGGDSSSSSRRDVYDRDDYRRRRGGGGGDVDDYDRHHHRRHYDDDDAGGGGGEHRRSDRYYDDDHDDYHHRDRHHHHRSTTTHRRQY